MWSAAHGLSPPLEVLPTRDEVDGGIRLTLDEADIDEFKTGRWASVPRRCISRETS